MDLRVSDIVSSKFNTINPVKSKDTNDNFSFTLNKLDESNLSERLRLILDDIDAVGSNLTKHMDISDMKKYRGLITNFINEVVTNSYEFKRENFLDRRGRHRVYGIVKQVNKDLDDLAKQLLEKEKNCLSILEKVGEIAGLLLDLLI